MKKAEIKPIMFLLRYKRSVYSPRVPDLFYLRARAYSNTVFHAHKLKKV
jgi:hypothetical protein